MPVNKKLHRGRTHSISGHGKSRMNVEDDRLSSLPDELILKILSLISIKQAIQTSVLSTRWRSIWTSVCCLNFSSDDIVPNFVSNVLSHRNNQMQVSSVKLGWISHDQYLIKEIIDYAFSHNVPQMTITCFDNESIVKFPLSLFTSQSLKHLTLSGPLSISSSFILRPTLDLPSLTTLHLDHITMSNNHNDIFSMCTNLKNLSLKGCKLMRTNVLSICHPRLSNLTIQDTYWWMEAINVVAPQLKNLTIINCHGKHLISTPGLTSLVMKGYHPFRIYTKGFCSLEKANLCIFDPILSNVYEIVSLLQQLHSVKFLTLNVEILKLLSSSMGLIDSHQLFPFANFKILKFSIIHPIRVYLEVRAKEEVTTFTEIKNDQVLDSSLTSSIFTIVSFEEISILRDIVSAEKLIAELRMGIEQCETHEQRKIERLLTIKLQHIEGRVTELPASKRLAVQATFSVVCKEAETVTNNMLDCMKIRYNKKLKRTNV